MLAYCITDSFLAFSLLLLIVKGGLTSSLQQRAEQAIMKRVTSGKPFKDRTKVDQ